MALDPPLAKQIKSDTATTLRLNQTALDGRDWAALNNYLKTTKTLREVDLSNIWGAMDSLAPGLESNRSITSLTLGYDLQEHNVALLARILKANTGITKLEMGGCYNMDEMALSNFVKFLKGNQTIAHLDLPNPGTPEREAEIKKAISALEDSPNILHFTPNTEGKLGDTCVANRAAAARLLKAATEDCETMSVADIQDIKTRLPAVLHKAENDAKLNAQQIAKMLINLEDVAATHGVVFPIPPRFADIADTLPRPFHPSADKVDFGTAGAVTAASAYRAAEAGQVDDLLRLLKNGQWKISAEDCLFRPAEKKESMIELVARQGKLADIMTVAHWVGDARGFRQAAEAVPAREWLRQMRDRPLEKLISQVNAASFKKAHRPQMRFG